MSAPSGGEEKKKRLVMAEVSGHSELIFGRHGVVQGHLKPFAFGPAVFEPELHVLRLEPGELLPVRHTVQFVRVLGDQTVRRMCVVLEPLLQSWHFADRIDKCSVPFPTLFGQR